MLDQVRTCYPAQIISFDAGKQTATVKLSMERIFQDIDVAVPRLSNVRDVIVVRTKKIDVKENDYVKCSGYIRTYHSHDKMYKSRIKVYTTDLEVIEKDKFEYYSQGGTQSNVVDYDVELIKSGRCRITPNGTRVIDLRLAYHKNQYRTDIFEAVAWGSNAVLLDSSKPGLKLHIQGRLQSRNYNKVIDGKKVKLVTHEVSIGSLGIIG